MYKLNSGNSLRSFRLEKKLNQLEMAEWFGIPLTDYSAMENGKLQVPYHVNFKIAEDRLVESFKAGIGKIVNDLSGSFLTEDVDLTTRLKETRKQYLIEWVRDRCEPPAVRVNPLAPPTELELIRLCYELIKDARSQN